MTLKYPITNNQLIYSIQIVSVYLNMIKCLINGNFVYIQWYSEKR